jgi:MFS family permease
VQGFSGALSDRLQKRKGIALAGYLAAAIAKPLMGFSTVWQGVFGARLLDRVGAGTRSAPRDALIASSVDENLRGKAFGLEVLAITPALSSGRCSRFFFCIHCTLEYALFSI